MVMRSNLEVATFSQPGPGAGGAGVASVVRAKSFRKRNHSSVRGIISSGRRVYRIDPGMKTTFFPNWRATLKFGGLLGVAMTILGLAPLAGLAQTTADPTNADVDAATAAAERSATNAVGAAAVSGPVTPTDIKLYGASAEVVKLAQAGVDESVMLSYVSNARAKFSLTSDQIIYLNDLGVSGAVVTAMLEHDGAIPSVQVPAGNQCRAASDLSAGARETAADNGEVPAAVPAPADNYDGGYYAPGYADDVSGYDGGLPVADDASYFYDSLAPYGSWYNVGGYGLCWQPTVYVRDHEWRPYGDRGRWLYTDTGWYWQSDYSWGWAAFHYGRWLRDSGLGWVWVPNRSWGPAWVSWRTTGQYAGWAPLPPSAVFVPGIGLRFGRFNVTANFGFGLTAGMYNFIPIERLSDYSPTRYLLGRTARANIFSQSLVANNINGQSVNLGVDPHRIEEAGGTPIRWAVVRDGAGGERDHRFRTDRLEHQNGSLVIFRPQLPAPEHQHSAVSATRAQGTTAFVVHSGSATAASAGSVGAPSRVQVTYTSSHDPVPPYATPSAGPAESAGSYPLVPRGGNVSGNWPVRPTESKPIFSTKVGSTVNTPEPASGETWHGFPAGQTTRPASSGARNESETVHGASQWSPNRSTFEPPSSTSSTVISPQSPRYSTANPEPRFESRNPVEPSRSEHYSTTPGSGNFSGTERCTGGRLPHLSQEAFSALSRDRKTYSAPRAETHSPSAQSYHASESSALSGGGGGGGHSSSSSSD